MSENLVDQRRALNGLRALSSLIIVIYHFKYFSSFPWEENIPQLRLGYLGVDFFFVLSGLIISHVYFQAMKTGKETFPRFVFCRVARILPVHLLIMVVMLIAALWTGATLSHKDILDWISLTLMVRQWMLPIEYAWNSPAWSVSAEMFAYIFVFPVTLKVAPLAADQGIGRRLCLAGAILLVLLIMRHGSVNDTSGIGPLLRVTAGFLIGSGLFHILAGCSVSHRWSIGLLGGAGLAIIGIAVLSEMMALIGLIAVTASAYMIAGPLFQILSARPLFTLGEWSFSLYLCHVPIFQMTSWAAAQMGAERGIVFCLMSLMVSLCVSGVLFHFVESPCRRCLRAWYDRRHVSGGRSSATQTAA